MDHQSQTFDAVRRITSNHSGIQAAARQKIDIFI